MDPEKQKTSDAKSDPENRKWTDEEWPIGMKPDGELRIVEEDGDAAEPTEENE